MSVMLIILLTIAFVALVMTIVFGVMAWKMFYGSEAKQLDARLQALGATRTQDEFQHERRYSQIPVVQDFLGRYGFFRGLDKQLIAAGFDKVQLDRFLLSVLVLSVFAFFLIEATGLSHIIALGGSAFALVAPSLYLSAKIKSRSAKFEEQLPDVLDFIARAMQAGHAFGPAIQMAASESPEPIASEFARAQSEINYGVPVTQALSDLAERIRSADMRIFAVAVAINREVGGDLAGLLEGIATLIRGRVDMRASVVAMSAEARFSALILGAMPFGVAALMMVISPGMLDILWTDPTGRDLLFGALGLMTVGAIWMRSMIKIRI